MELRSSLRPGDLGAIVQLHGEVYAREHGFDSTFEAYVAAPMAACVERNSPRDRIWIAEDAGRIVGCVAIVALPRMIAQLRWFLVAPEQRGRGLGSRLLTEAIVFSRRSGYQSVDLWTVSALTGAARLYQRMGFVKVEEKPARRWGVDVVEERYQLELADRGEMQSKVVSGSVMIRACDRTDMESIRNIMNRVLADGESFVYEAEFNPEDMEKYASQFERCFVAERDGRVVGAYFLRPNLLGRGSHIANAAYLVAPEARGGGIGAALGEHSILEARRAGYSAMQFNAVVASNGPAVRLWTSLGFTVIGTVPDAFRRRDGAMADLIIMHRVVE